MPSVNAKTSYLETAVLNHVLRNTPFTSPSAVYVALFTSPTGEDGSGTEVSGGGYARQAVTFGAPVAGTAGRKVANTSDITFGPATAPWGTVTHVALFDAPTGGNMLYHGALEEPKTIGTNDRLIFPAGSLSIEER
jgi:hypothetical protein